MAAGEQKTDIATRWYHEEDKLDFEGAFTNRGKARVRCTAF
jgi:hypothetical protein